jgi:hypothetical protein
MKLGLVLALFAVGALAQDKPALRIVVDGVVKEAAACGLGVPAIEAVASRTLKSHDIAVSKNPADPYLYLHVNAYRVMQGADVVGCSTRIGVSVRAGAGAGTVRGFKPKSEAYVVVCEAGRLLSGAQRDIVAAVARAFEQDIKSCLAQLSY